MGELATRILGKPIGGSVDDVAEEIPRLAKMSLEAIDIPPLAGATGGEEGS